MRAVGSALALAMMLVPIAAHAARIVVLDDGEKVARESEHALADSVWPWSRRAIESCFRPCAATTVAFQVVALAEDAPLLSLHAELGDLVSTREGKLGARVEVLSERFVHIERPSGNAYEPGESARVHGRCCRAAS